MLVCRLVWMCGSATLTIVLSSSAMNSARLSAASAHQRRGSAGSARDSTGRRAEVVAAIVTTSCTDEPDGKSARSRCQFTSKQILDTVTVVPILCGRAGRCLPVQEYALACKQLFG